MSDCQIMNLNEWKDGTFYKDQLQIRLLYKCESYYLNLQNLLNQL